jgi:hypothetical protein
MEAQKKKRQSIGRQSAQYDKIFKENIEAVISSIMQNIPHGRPRRNYGSFYGRIT